MRWADPSLAEWWSTGRDQPPSPDALERRRRFLLFQQELTIALHRAGVSLLAGTDTPNPLLVPGFSLHDELAALVDAGLEPVEALRAATVNAGRFLEPPGELGVAARGALADLVIVDRNPLDDTGALRRPWAVVSRGALLDRAALDALLERAARSMVGRGPGNRDEP
jgi:imidazolonepropionase-like amidohydrolase